MDAKVHYRWIHQYHLILLFELFLQILDRIHKLQTLPCKKVSKPLLHWVQSLSI